MNLKETSRCYRQVPLSAQRPFRQTMTRMKASIAVLSCLVLAMMVTPAATYGQTDTATILGTVADAAGSVVAGAEVSVVNTGTNIKTTVKTGAQGNYIVTPLRIGNYSITVAGAGFKTETREGIVLEVQDRLKIDFALQVGSVHEDVVVQGAGPMLETESSTLGQVVAAKQITDLPLNGRDYTQLASMTTGVIKIKEGNSLTGTTTASNGNAGGSFAVNGTRGTLNNFILDGVDNNSNDNGGNVLKTNVDALAEFKVQTSNYSAEFGRSGGAVINATIKSGSNAFRGTAFEFIRNDALDARAYFEQPGTKKAPYRQNQFGATFGGPIWRNKTFFFVDYQGTRIGTSSIDFSTVPTLANSNGDFSAQYDGTVSTTIFDPATTKMVDGQIVRTPFPGNIIPASRFDTIAHNMALLYPAPNVPGATGNNYVRVDPGTYQVDQGDVRVDHSITDRQLIFARYSMSQTNNVQQPPMPGLADGSRGAGLYVDDTRGVAIGHTYTLTPTMVNDARFGFNREKYATGVPLYGLHYPGEGYAVPGVPNDPRVNGLTLFRPNGYQRLGFPLFAPTDGVSEEFQYGDTLSLIRGRHSMKIGVQFHRSLFSLLQIGSPRGVFRFSGQFTADDPSAGDGSGASLADMLLGLPNDSNISNTIKFANRQNTYGAFIQDDFKVSPRLALNLGIRYDYTTPIYEADNHQSNFDYNTASFVVAGVNGASRGLVNTDRFDFSPRVGLAYSALKNTVVRAGYGRFYSYQEIRTGDPFQLAYNAPFIDQPDFPSDGVTPILTVSGGFPALDPHAATGESVTVSAKGYGTHLNAPSLDEWNLNIQQQLPASIALEIAYVGSRSTHLQSVIDPNQDPTPGPGDIQSRRRYPQFSSFNAIVNEGASTYDALEIKAEKRFSHGLTFLSAFTFSKSINDMPEICCASPTPQNSFDIGAERGVSDFNQKYRWVSSFDYVLPFGHGERFLNSGRAVDLALGGWHLGGIYTMHTGFYFSPWLGYDPSNTGSIGAVRSDRTCNGNLPPAQRNINNWFDADCFPLPTGYAFGDSGKNVLIGPGSVSGDMALRKIFNFTETRNLEFRFEMFNAFNHASFSLPDNFIDDGPGSTAVITSTVLAQRQIQLGLKLHF
jgi:Carboxypeptidase regulatory-like domain/TonB dependent receptor